MTDTLRPASKTSPSVGMEPTATGSEGYTLLAVSDKGFRSIPLRREQKLKIGRRDSNDLVIDHPSVSREHALIYGGDPPEVEDLQSSNGTLVQGLRIEPQQRVPLGIGSVIAIGNVSIFLRQGVLAADPRAASTEANSKKISVTDDPGVSDGMVLRDRKMHDLYEHVKLVAQSMMPVLIFGETGVGKELLAESLHNHSARRERPLLRVNCAALAEGILASELFGHERGAFTGAHAMKLGLFEAADGGTIFLDEVGELSPTTQAKLLRVLESGEVTRVGANRSKQVDVRVISATNRDLRSMIQRGRFRADLYYRLNGVSVVVPPLRERPGDIMPLAELFAGRFASRLSSAPPAFSEDAKSTLQRYRWPGNVRELKHVVERSVLLTHGAAIEPSALQLDGAEPSAGHDSPFMLEAAPDSLRNSELLRAADSPRHPDSPREHEPLRARAPRTTMPDGLLGDRAPRSSRGTRLRASRRTEQLRAELARAERDRILEALQQAGTQAGAAKLLGLSRRALIYRLDAYGIPRPRKGNDRDPE
ncbi:MAG TPA: sigma 54-interacting transcriptional regulator [Polyangiaceae bacterium]